MILKVWPGLQRQSAGPAAGQLCQRRLCRRTARARREVSPIPRVSPLLPQFDKGDGVRETPPALESRMGVFRTISGAILCVLILVVTVACGSPSVVTATPASPPTSAAISTTPPAPSENASALAAETLAAESRAAASSSSAAKTAAAKAAASKAAASKAAAAKAAVAKAAAEKAAADKASAAAAAASAKASAAQAAAQATAAQQAQAPSQAAPACTPGYSPCIPPGPDVDCAGGSGNGPRYVQGPVTVTGSDPYGLDSDHDGIGCEN